MRDYYIAVDENGQPYIEHGFLDRVKGSKYYQKIKTAYGTRYFYDPEEWKAYVEGRGNKPTSLIGKAKDKLGFDERQRYKNTNDQFMKAYNSNPNSDKTRELALKAHNLNVAYNNTALGTAEYAAGRVKEAVKDKVTRMREEFQKRNNAQYSDYNENDPDFNDENYTEDRRVGKTDFFMFKGNNGRTVIVEEDMKWTLPKDIDPNSPEIRAALEKADDLPGETWEEWAKNVSSSLDEAIKVARNK